MGKKRIYQEGDLVAFKLPDAGDYGLALLARYRRAKSIYDEAALWYFLDFRFLKPPTLATLPPIGHKNIIAVQTFGSPVSSPHGGIRLGTLPGFTREQWPFPPFGGRGYNTRGWNDGKYLDVQEDLDGPVARIHGLFELSPAQYRKLPLRRASTDTSFLPDKLESCMAPKYPGRLRVTSKTFAFWTSIIQRAKALGYLDPIPKPRVRRKWTPPEFGTKPRTLWSIIDRAAEVSLGKRRRFLDALQHYFKTSLGRERAEIRRTLRAAIATAHRWDLWGAAYIMNRGCSDDGFVYFRGWLISQGFDRYHAALKRPDSLAIGELRFVHRTDGCEFEELIEILAGHADWMSNARLSGMKWDIEDYGERQRRFPKLVAKFGDEDRIIRGRRPWYKLPKRDPAELEALEASIRPTKQNFGTVMAFFNVVGPYQTRVIGSPSSSASR
jgi:hypothetical protein